MQLDRGRADFTGDGSNSTALVVLPFTLGPDPNSFTPTVLVVGASAGDLGHWWVSSIRADGTNPGLIRVQFTVPPPNGQAYSVHWTISRY
jgi:hypothetical protein